MKPTDWLRLCALSVLWGGSFLFYRILATALPPTTTVFSRVAIGAVALLAVLAVQGIRLQVPRLLWPRLALLALLNNAVPFTLFAWAETRVTGGTASILNALTPVFTVLVAGLVLRSEAITRLRLVGIACGLAGVLVLVGPDALLGADLWGQAACLLAAISYGFALPLGRTIKGLAPQQMATAQLLLASAMTLPLVLILDQPWSLPPLGPAAWLAMIGLGLLSTGLAYILFFGLLASAGATNLSLVTLLVPVSALLLGHAVLAEPVTPQAVAGMVLIAAGLVAIDGRLFRAGAG